MMSFNASLLALLALALIAQAKSEDSEPTPSTNRDRSTTLSEAFSPNKVKPFAYRPVDGEFWSQVVSDLKQNNSVKVIEDGAKKAKSAGENSASGAEGQLALAMGLRQKGFSFAAFSVFEELAKDKSGTDAGEAALHELSDLALDAAVDQQELEELLTQNEFGPVHSDIQSFVSSYRYLRNLKFGFQSWAEKDKALIQPGSPWQSQIQYLSAVGDVARGAINRARDQFKLLTEAKETPANIKRWAHLQLARLTFEQGQFQAAYDLYQQAEDLGVREKGRVLLEIAWTRYYLKDYEKTLGLLKTLKAPYFLPSLSPERYVLEILSYRDLCHYEAAQEVVQGFRQNFKSSLSAIRRREPLREDPVLARMALMDRDLQERANLIDQLRREREEFSEFNWRKFKFYRPLLDKYSRRDSFLRRQLDLELENKVRLQAEQVLDADEQIQFLDYTSKLDALRIVRSGEDRNYSSGPISHLTFESIYWPVENEYWWDELNDFKVLISSRCSQASSPISEKAERKFR